MGSTSLLGKLSADFKWAPQSDSFWFRTQISEENVVFVPDILLYCCSRTLHQWELKALSCCCVPVDHCMAPVKVGPCRGSFPRWHYNAASQKCEKFTFGGCRENLNNYLSEDECTNACASSGISSLWLYIDLNFLFFVFLLLMMHSDV